MKKYALEHRNVIVNEKRTSIRLEKEMWNALSEISGRENKKISEICSSISFNKQLKQSLTSAIRVFIMQYFRDIVIKNKF